MTAKGKVNASQVQVGDRIIVKVTERGDSEFSDYSLDLVKADWMVTPSKTKTGEKVYVTTVTGKDKCINRRGYMIETGRGTFYAEPIQTMWLAPEDAPGIKRAYAEALTEAEEREAKAAEELVLAATETDTLGPVLVAGEEINATQEERAEAQEVQRLREEYPGAPAARRVAIRRRLLQLNATLVEGQEDGEDDLEKDCLRARFDLAGSEERQKIIDRLRVLGTVVFPEGTPEYAEYRTNLRRALMDKSQWESLLER